MESRTTTVMQEFIDQLFEDQYLEDVLPHSFSFFSILLIYKKRSDAEKNGGGGTSRRAVEAKMS